MTGTNSNPDCDRRTIPRRHFLRAGAALVGGSTVAAPVGAQSSKPSFGGWFAKTENYDGVHDLTGKSEVTVTVGPSDVGGGPLAYAPAAIRVSPGTTVVWKWTGKGGSHNVVASDGSFKSKLTSQQGHTFQHTFEKTGVHKYYCTPHKALGMRGVVVVGDVELGGQGGGATGGTNTSGPLSNPLLGVGLFGALTVVAAVFYRIVNSEGERHRVGSTEWKRENGLI